MTEIVQNSLQTTPSSPPNGAGSPPARPQTPPQSTELEVSGTPRTPRPMSTPQTPRTIPQSASVYLSSPIRRSRNHTNLLASAAMTPGRPSLKFPSNAIPSSPFKFQRYQPPASSFSSSPNGNVQLDSKESVLMPLQTMLMTKDQVEQITSLDRAKELLTLSIDQSEQFRQAAQQFRQQANNLSFQQKLSQIERNESEQRHEVESNIQQREIEKLVFDIMGYSDRSINSEQIRRKLKRTKNRLKEMEELLSQKEEEISKLKEQLNKPPPPPPKPEPATEPLSALEVLASQVLSQGMNNQQYQMSMYPPLYSPEKRRRGSSSTISMSGDDTVDA